MKCRLTGSVERLLEGTIGFPIVAGSIEPLTAAALPPTRRAAAQDAYGSQSHEEVRQDAELAFSSTDHRLHHQHQDCEAEWPLKLVRALAGRSRAEGSLLQS